MCCKQFLYEWEFWIEVCKLLFIGVGAIWALRKYIRYNEGEAKLEFDVNINYIGKDKNGRNLLELEALISNKGKVRQKICMKDFTFSVNYHTGVEFVDSIDINNQVGFSKVEHLQKKTWILSKEKYEEEKNIDYIFINGETNQRLSYNCCINSEAVYVLLRSKIKYTEKEKDYHSAQKIIKITKHII